MNNQAVLVQIALFKEILASIPARRELGSLYQRLNLLITFPPCKGKNCGATDGISHSLECQAEHEATVNPNGIYDAPASEPRYFHDPASALAEVENDRMVAEKRVAAPKGSVPKGVVFSENETHRYIYLKTIEECAKVCELHKFEGWIMRTSLRNKFAQAIRKLADVHDDENDCSPYSNWMRTAKPEER